MNITRIEIIAPADIPIRMTDVSKIAKWLSVRVDKQYREIPSVNTVEVATREFIKLNLDRMLNTTSEMTSHPSLSETHMRLRGW